MSTCSACTASSLNGIQGGGFFEGGSPDKRYNLSFIVQNGVDVNKPFIGVSINYRLSAW